MARKPTFVGKVRESYSNKSRLMVVATDRISVYDVVLDSLVPDKGKVLTAITKFWLTGLLADIPNHFITDDIMAMPEFADDIPDFGGRSMLVRRAEMLPLECIVRGYLYGSVMNEYREHGTATGIELPPGLELASELPEPLFTPSTKATTGHDQNINVWEACELVEAQFPHQGTDLVMQARAISLKVYRRAAAYALTRGIRIADTKFEFGLIDGQLVLCDEVLTPDSSRFWVADSWEPGKEPESYDKQFVRNYYQAWRDPVTGNKWNKKPPAPPLMSDIIAETRRRYLDVYEQLTGQSLKLN